MRSRLGTKSRLAAHITALVLLMLVLAYMPSAPLSTEGAATGSVPDASEMTETPATTVAARPETPEPATTKTPEIAAEPTSQVRETAIAPPESAKPAAVVPPVPKSIPDAAGTIEPSTPSSGAALPAEAARTTGDPVAASDGIAAAPAPSADTPSGKADAAPESPATTATEPEKAAAPATPSAGSVEPDPIAAIAAEVAASHGATATPGPDDKPETVAPPATGDETVNAGGDAPETTGGSDKEDATDAPAVVQPDESGSMVIASDSVPDIIKPIKPFPGANLEVLGDNVYWLDPQHDLEKELAAVPDIGTLILLVHMPGYWLKGFEHVKPEIITADITDLSEDAAAHFLHLTADAKRPVVAAALPGARGAAFFKGAYLLARRNLNPEDLEAEIGPELEDAGDAAEEILHRLRRLDVKRLR